MRPRIALLALLLASAGCSSTSTGSISPLPERTEASIGGGTRMQMLGHAFAPPAFHDFCNRYKALCATDGSLRPVELTTRHHAELASVNKAVNRRVIERSDLATTGREDDWRLPGKYGDCEDFALLKKAELMKLGWPASALLLTVARSGGEGHTVLTVRTTKGDLVLDNMTDAVKDWSRTPYRYFARQSPGNGRNWERIGTAKPVI
ncbi:transglutaminase-like cysteine peptidase [Chelativorans sp. AA-79]|uniref:transglutaminase-like cysteine peptidase n=1 Tax=Chelativorans sp. AA-79 TaxID=3028735 RepID=UPI0023F88C69|nr:transglutaminase-like cysteine peptidase [Chelativorans sp. AA-79]WEX07646.1 transglutaminase-like cysteine peptidase [Chelativorans sp. AA-79]